MADPLTDRASPVGTDTILDDIKKQLNVVDDDFDSDVIAAINSAFASLHQLGVGPAAGFYIESNDSPKKKWTDFCPKGPVMSLTKSYVYKKARLEFDPPGQPSSLLTSLENEIKQDEFRLNIYAEGGYDGIRASNGD